MRENEMKALMTVCLLLAIALPALAQQDQDPAAAQEAWLKAAMPGEFHAFLAKKAGKWQIAGKMWPAPGQDPVASESTAEAEMILGGRYLLEKMQGSAMGMPFEGLGVTGYDNVTGTVTATWWDTMGTGTMVMTGQWEEPGAPMVTTGTTIDPASGGEMQLRTVTTFVNDDESVFEYFATMPGMPETKVMELHYTRLP
jgi:hypothetical protein